VIRVASCFCNTFEKLFELEANRRGSSVMLSPKSIADRGLTVGESGRVGLGTGCFKGRSATREGWTKIFATAD